MTDVILRISGMDCGACAVRIVCALRGLPGVHAVFVSDTAGCARLTYDEAAVGLGEIARCVQRAGFDVPVETAELRCPGADDGAEARLRAVFGVRSAARAGDTFMVTLWPVGTDAAALPAVLGPGAELTAQRGGEEAQQGRTRQRLARRLGFGVLLTALMLWRLPELVQLALAAAVLFGAGAALWRGTWRVLRGGSLGPDAPGLLAALILFAYSAYATFTGLRPCFPAPCGIVCALLAGKYAAQLVRGALHAPVRRLRHLRPRTATVVRDGVGTQVDADALTPRDVVRVLPGERVPVDGVVCSGTCTVDASALTGAAGRRKRRWGTQFWPARSTARAAHSSRPRRSATRRRCSGRSQPCSAHRPCAHRSRCGSSGRHHASPRCSSFWRSALAPYGFSGGSRAIWPAR